MLFFILFNHILDTVHLNTLYLKKARKMNAVVSYLDSKMFEQLNAIKEALSPVKHVVAIDKIFIKNLLVNTKLDLDKLGISQTARSDNRYTFIHVNHPFTEDLFMKIKQVLPDARYEKDQVVNKNTALSRIVIKFTAGKGVDNNGDPVSLQSINYTWTPFATVPEGLFELHDINWLNLLDVLHYTPIELASKKRTLLKMLIVAHFIEQGFTIEDFMRPVRTLYSSELLVETTFKMHQLIAFVKDYMK